MEQIKNFSLAQGDPLYEPVVTYCAGLIILSSLHHEPIRSLIINLPEIAIQGKVIKNIFLPMDIFRPWLRNLHKASNHAYLVRYTIWLAQKALAESYQLILDQRMSDGSEILQFLRHIRNGVSHGNRFRFGRRKNKRNIWCEEPTRIARWKGVEITRSLQDDKTLKVVPDFLPIGDALILLHDVNVYLREKIAQKCK